MKYLAPLFACLVLISCSHPKKVNKNDLETLHYKGKVKAVAYNVYKAIEKDGKIEKGTVVNKLQTNCNQDGYFVEQSTFKGDKLYYRIIHRYDSTNTLIEQIRVQQAVVYMSQGNTRPDSMSESHVTYSYLRDKNGNKIETKVMHDGKQQYRDENKFDLRGNIIELNEYIPWDTLQRREVCKYDDKDNMIEKRGYLPNGKMIFKYTFQYNASGNMTEMDSYKADSTLELKEEMKYDDKGNKISDTRVMADGIKNFDWRFEFKEFDKEGNWIKEISYRDNKPEAITERLLEYYK